MDKRKGRTLLEVFEEEEKERETSELQGEIVTINYTTPEDHPLCNCCEGKGILPTDCPNCQEREEETPGTAVYICSCQYGDAIRLLKDLEDAVRWREASMSLHHPHLALYSGPECDPVKILLKAHKDHLERMKAHKEGPHAV